MRVSRLVPGVGALVLALALTSCAYPPLTATRLRRAQLNSDASGIQASYAADRCETFDHAEVAYGRRALAITIFLRKADQPCLGVRLLRRTFIPLHEPLGGRLVRDGSI